MRLKWRGDKVKKRVKKNSTDRLRKCAILVEREAKRLMKPGGGKARTPSPPGKPPHTQTGALRSSIASAMKDKGTAIAGPVERYGYYHEHEYGSRMHPQRPFMRPALMNVKSDFAKQFKSITVI